MPLIHGKSKNAPSNDSPAPESKSLAVAYSIKRNAQKGKMAKGGHVHGEECMAEGGMCYAKGGEVHEMDSFERPNTLAEAIMNSRKDKMYAEGGMADIEDNGEEMSNDLDDLNEDAVKKELYDDSQLEAQPMDSNEDGDSIDSDAYDMVSAIRKKIRSNR